MGFDTIEINLVFTKLLKVKAFNIKITWHTLKPITAIISLGKCFQEDSSLYIKKEITSHTTQEREIASLEQVLNNLIYI